MFEGLNDTLSRVGAARDDNGGSKAKVRDPVVFDGTDPRKLQTFLVELSLVFTDRPNYFTDSRKVAYTLSYLGGSAKEWFEPDLLNPDPTNPPLWMLSFQALVQELTDNFGVYDMEGEAEDKLGQLKMKENETVRKYIIRFNSLAASANWDASALAWAFRRGLASRIKDELMRIRPEPVTLRDLRREVQAIDNRYWKREEEKKREQGPTRPPAHVPKQGNPRNQTNVSVNVQPTPSTSANPPTSHKPKGNNPRTSTQATSEDLSKKLDATGKLTSEEKERRKRLNLCLFCGKPGHKISECNKRKAAEAKGRITTTTPGPEPSSAAKPANSGK